MALPLNKLGKLNRSMLSRCTPAISETLCGSKSQCQEGPGPNTPLQGRRRLKTNVGETMLFTRTVKGIECM